jgi:tetratricopeptide (TPR) repeat protein
VFVALADIWDATTAREVALAARLDINKTSSFLKRLVARGAVEITEQEKRKKFYQVAERLYNIYHLMRRRGAVSVRVQAAVKFMTCLYEGEELVGAASSIAREACELDSASRGDHYQAYESVLNASLSGATRQQILAATPNVFFQAADLPTGIREAALDRQETQALQDQPDSMAPDTGMDAQAWIASGQRLWREDRKPVEAEAAFRKAIELEPTSPSAPVCLGALFLETGRIEEAHGHLRSAVELDTDYAPAHGMLGLLLHEKLDEYAEAEQAYRKAIEINAKYAWVYVQLGQLLHEKLDRHDEAEQAYRKAIELGATYPWVHAELAKLLHEELGRYDEAEQAYRKTIELDPKNDWAHAHLGELLHERLDRNDEAERAYRRAIELDPEYTWAHAQLGELLHDKLERYGEAERAYRKSIELDDKNARAHARLGQLLHEKLERYDEAEKAYRRAIELRPEFAWVYSQLGELLYAELGRLEEAEQACRQAVHFAPGNAWAHALLGLLLDQGFERFDEAERTYAETTRIEPSIEWGWLRLIRLQNEKLRLPERALETARRFVAQQSREPEALNAIAWLCVDRGWSDFLGEAESWAREAVEKGPDSARYAHTLASVLAAQGQWREALDLAPRFLTNERGKEEQILAVTGFFIDAAASGHGQEAVRVITESELAGSLEPLVVGLRVFLGEKVRTAQEILEVGKDVAERIRKRRDDPAPGQASR